MMSNKILSNSLTNLHFDNSSDCCVNHYVVKTTKTEAISWKPVRL